MGGQTSVAPRLASLFFFVDVAIFLVERLFFCGVAFFWWSGSSTGECFAIPSSAAQHCCRRCNPMNLLQILAAAFNALHFTKHRKSQLEAAKAKRKEKSAPNN